MALGSTVYTLDIDLSNVDRGVYDALAMRVARHPSESAEYFTTRVIAYCLEHTEGIAFSAGGLSSPDEPAIAVRDLTGAILTWIDIGMPDAARLHKASKAARRVVVYTHRDAERLVSQLSGERIHNADAIELYALDRALVDAVAAKLERRMAFSLTATDAHLLIAFDAYVIEGDVVRHALNTARQ